MTMPTAAPSPLAVVPSLDDLARDPERATTLPLDTAQALYARVLVCQAALLPRLLAPAVGAASSPPLLSPAPEWITAEKVHEHFGLDASWLGEHRRELQSRKIVSPVSRKVRLYNVVRLRRLIEGRAGG